MVHGKVPTWFHFATHVMDRYGFDYAIKSDFDTYLQVDKFFEMANAMLFPHASNIYCGMAYYCPRHRHVFMEGKFYLLSRDLAEEVASVALSDVPDLLHSEDRDLGRILLTRHAPPLYMVELRDMQGNVPFFHPVKTRGGFRNRMKEEQKRLWNASTADNNKQAIN